MSKLINEVQWVDVALLYADPERNFVRHYDGHGSLTDLIKSFDKYGWDQQQQSMDGQPFTPDERKAVHAALQAKWDQLAIDAKGYAADSDEQLALAVFVARYVRGGKLVADRYINSGNRREAAIQVSILNRIKAAIAANQKPDLSNLLKVRYVDKVYKSETERRADLAYRNEFRSVGSREMGHRDRLATANMLFAAGWTEGRIGEVIKRGAAQKLVPILKLDRKFKSLNILDRCLIAPNDKERKEERIDLTPIQAADLRERFFTTGTSGKPAEVKASVTATAVAEYLKNPKGSGKAATSGKAMSTANIAKLAEASAATVVQEVLTGVTANDAASIGAVTKAAPILNLAWAISRQGSPAALAEAVKALKGVCDKHKLPYAIDSGESAEASAEPEAEPKPKAKAKAKASK